MLMRSDAGYQTDNSSSKNDIDGIDGWLGGIMVRALDL